jgi:hypothetical protein
MWAVPTLFGWRVRSCAAIKRHFSRWYLKGLDAPKGMRRHVLLMCIRFGVDDHFFSLSLSTLKFHVNPFKKSDKSLNLFPLHNRSISFWLLFFIFWISHEITNIFQSHPFLIFNLLNLIPIFYYFIFIFNKL